MLYVGPEIMDLKLSVTTLVAGRSPAIVGPVGTVVVADWVFLGHEALTVTYLRPSDAVISYMASDATADHLPMVSAAAGDIRTIMPAPPDVYAFGIDDVALRNIRLNGAEVRQWQHPTGPQQ